MDQTALVSGGHALIRALDAGGLPPRLAMWVHATDTDTWKLWLVPPENVTDKHEFYRRVAHIISKHRIELGGLDAGDIEMVLEKHPAVQGLKATMRMSGLHSTSFSGNVLNGFYLPDGLILRVDFPEQKKPDKAPQGRRSRKS